MRGIYEKLTGSGEWWIRYADVAGKIRREKAGTKGDAIDLYQRRKADILRGKKLPEKLRARALRFTELCDDAIAYSKANNLGHRQNVVRIEKLREEFGNRPADINVGDFRRWFDTKDWSDATFNRYKAILSLIYRLGIEHKKATDNPARLLKHRTENNARIRYLNEHEPRPTKVRYLKPCKDEETRLRAVIEHEYPEHLPEFEIALNTGMRPSEQYSLTWNRVSFSRRQITIPRSKNTKPKHIPLNSVALAAFKRLHKRRRKDDRDSVFLSQEGEPLRGYKHWFEPAVEKAGLRHFTWYCLRHTFASRLVMKGIHLRTVADLMGHKTIQMTMRYAHLAPSQTQAAVEALVERTDTTTDTRGLAQVGGT